MEKNVEVPNNEAPSVSKGKVLASGTAKKLKSDPAKRKSFYVNEAVRSLDLALGRVKKTKFVNEYTCSSSHTSPSRRSTAGSVFNDNLTTASNADTASMMSMNFSHYELMRNLSHSNCNSDSAFSTTTCNASSIPFDSISKNEQLEKYFRSIEMWSKNYSPQRRANNK
ncbi:unnamed protein product [Colias eurytheme]|nr:unnamed protein product [Colias eurytheme]